MDYHTRLLKAGWAHLRGKAYAGRELVVYPDDVFLISYLRSGNTWMRFLIGNLAHPQQPVTFTNIESFIPDIDDNTDKQLESLPRPRIIKSHECFDPRYKKVIYLVRDPRDVAVSMYHWCIKVRRFNEDYPMIRHVERFIAGDYEYTAGSWAENVSCWLLSRSNDPNFILVRYEGMLRQPRAELARIATFLGIESSDERLAQAIERSSPDRMRSLEKAQAAKWLTTARTRQDRPFARAAKSGNWQTDLPRDAVALIEAAWWPIMNTLGYELASSPQTGSEQPAVSKEVWAALTDRVQRQLLICAHRPSAAGRRSAGCRDLSTVREGWLAGRKKFTVSAIIPTKNRPADLAAALRSLFRQTVIPDQLIIVDQSASDESERQVRSLYAEASAEIRNRLKLDYVHEPNISGLATARNRALDMVNADADVTLFLDDDVVWEPDYVERLLDVYSSYPEAVGVSGVPILSRSVFRESPPILSRRIGAYTLWRKIFVMGRLRDDRQPVYWNADRLLGASPIRVSRLTGAQMSFRTEAIRGIRFDKNLQGVSDGEDVDFCLQLGPEAILLINPRARLVHNASPVGAETSHWLQREARAIYYLYHKNWNQGLFNRLSFAWLNAGYAFIATLGSVRRLSLTPWRALLDGRRDAQEIQRRARLASRA